MDKLKVILLPVLSGLFVGAIVFVILRFWLSSPAESSKPTGEGTLDNSIGELNSDVGKASQIVVEIAGAVVKPGVYKMPADTRVGDLVEVAGGLTGEVAVSYLSSEINLAKKIKDEDKVYIPYLWDISDLVKLSSSVNTKVSPNSGSFSANDDLVDINEASVEELDTLPGIGPAYAQRLVDNRPFQNWGEVLSKSKVPAAVLEKLKNLTTYK